MSTSPGEETASLPLEWGVSVVQETAETRSGSTLSAVELAVREAGEAREATLSAASRSQHGVVHTPAPLCRYLLRRVDRALRVHGWAQGLQTPALTVVDPACGTGAFFASLLHSLSDPSGLRLVGVDIDEGALRAAERALTPHLRGADLSLIEGDVLADEALFARLRDGEGPLVVLGNPPWAGKSASKAPLSETHLDAFRRDEQGKPLAERKIGVLSDAYVRFFAWAHALFEERAGVLAFVANASFLDGPVHRGMRSAILRRFDGVEITDLGGSSLVAREQGLDENVFGVRPGVSVAVAARSAGQGTSALGFHRLLGSREDKLTALGAVEDEDLGESFSPEAPLWLWRPIRGARYGATWCGVDTLFPFHREGVQTNRDAVVIDADRDALLGRMQTFALGLALPALDVAGRSTGHYDAEKAREAVRQALTDDPEGKSWIGPLAYRPFDKRYFVRLPALCHRPRKKLAQAVDHSSFSLVTVRKDRGGRAWSHLYVARDVIDNCVLSARSSCRARAFPTHDPDGQPNLSAQGKAWADDLGGDEAAPFYYVVAWLASPTYRARFAGVLPLGYPEVPPPFALGARATELMEVGRAIVEAFVEYEGPPGETKGPRALGHWPVAMPETLQKAVAAADTIVCAVFEEDGNAFAGQPSPTP